MTRHTSATPAGVPRSRASKTRRERGRVYALGLWYGKPVSGGTFVEADSTPVYIRHGDGYLHIREAQRRGIPIPPIEIDKPMEWRNFVTTHGG